MTATEFNALPDYALQAETEITKLVNSKGIDSWKELLIVVRNLPYGRNLNRSNFGLVITEGKGSCSSKHAFLKQVAIDNDIPAVQLMLAIYKMNTYNTPGIGRTLYQQNIDYLPEAHCFLRINDVVVDLTTNHSTFDRIKNDILEERIIEPHDVIENKVNIHKSYISEWLNNNVNHLDFDKVWSLREQCIKALESKIY